MDDMQYQRTVGIISNALSVLSREELRELALDGYIHTRAEMAAQMVTA